MAGVTNRKYADGCYRIWYIDRTGKQIFAKGTGNRRESLRWAMTLQTKEHGIGLGIFPAPSLQRFIDTTRLTRNLGNISHGEGLKGVLTRVHGQRYTPATYA